MVLYGIVTVNNLQKKYYKTNGVYCKPITPHIITGTETNIHGVYAIQQVSLNVYFTCKFPN